MPNAKLPFSFFKVLNTDSKGFEFCKNWVTKRVITSVSVCELNFNPWASKSFFNSSEFSIIPLWTTETTSEEWGCALTIFGTPWVAHLTWPIPMLPFEGFLNKIFSSSSTLPEHFFSSIKLLLKVAKPALSYPLYSNFFKELIILIDTGLLLAIPIIPHIIFSFFYSF